MASQLMGSEYVMVDRTSLMTEVIGNRSERHCLDLMLKDMIEREEMVAGLDISWSPSNINRALLAICSRIGSILVWIEEYQTHSSPWLRHFLDNKDITFFGVHMKEDVKRMRRRTSFGIRNIVDVSDLATDVLHQPRLRALGVGRLASEVLCFPFQTRSFSRDQIECVTINAYSAYKIGMKLLECH